MAEQIDIGNNLVYIAHPSGVLKGGIVLIHEVWGLTEHIKSVAERLASEGYLVYAPDLLKDTGIEEKVTAQIQQDLFNPERRSIVQPKLRELMAPIQSPEFALKTVNSLKEVFAKLFNEPETKENVAVIGFCFGGTYSFSLAVNEPRLSAAVPFYGHADQSVEELRKITCPVLAFYGEKDENLMGSLPDLENRMHEAQVDFSAQVYTNCGHAFFNDTNPYAYNEQAAKDSWKRTLEFLEAKFA